MRSWLFAIVVAAVLGCVGASDSPAFPGANGRLVFEEGGDLQVMDGDGMARGPLGIVGDQPAWSADGEQLAFARGAAGRADLWIADADGGNQRLVVQNAQQPAWSPNGSWIVFSRGASDSVDIWLVRPDGTRQHRITPHRGRELLPAWSPDGRRIAYSGQHHCRTGGRCTSDIYVMNPDGSKRRRLTRTRSDDASPSWSPDGRWIVFVRFADETVPFAIAVMRADGTQLRRVTPFRDQYFPVWSPDGKWIVYRRQGDIWRMRPSGKEHLNLTRTPLDEDHPDWAPR